MTQNIIRWLAVSLLCLVLWPSQPALAAEPERDKWLELMQAGSRALGQRNFTEAERQFKAGLKVAEEGLGPTDRAVVSSHKILARLYEVVGRLGDAKISMKLLLNLQQKFHGPMHMNIAVTLNNLGEIHRREKNYTEAESLYKRSLAISESVEGKWHPAVGAVLNNLALAYHLKGRYGEAEPLYKRSLAIREKAFGPNHPYVAESLENYADLLAKTGRGDLAEPMEARAKTIRAKHARDKPSN